MRSNCDTVEEAPDEAAAASQHNFGVRLAAEGQFAAARAYFCAAIGLMPDNSESFHALAQITGFGDETPLVRQMLRLHDRGGLSRRKQTLLCFGLAKVFADLGETERAMRFCEEANSSVQPSWDAAGQRAELEALRRMAAVDAFRGIEAAAAGRLRPVFVVGMPRSGTTLVEAVLAAHPDVFAGGETTHIPEVEAALLGWARHRGHGGGLHEMLPLVPAEIFAANAAVIEARVRQVAGRPAAVFVDKLPDNSQRLGLIAKLFPAARIIHVRRHPLDCCFSCYFQHFAQGQGFSYRQDLLGGRYRQVAETMQLWKQCLDLKILEVCYERLVADPEPTVRRIVAFAGLDWYDACRAPERAGNRVVTASQWQVRQPINDRSIGRSTAYERRLGPLVEALGGPEWIEAEHCAAVEAHGSIMRAI